MWLHEHTRNKSNVTYYDMKSHSNFRSPLVQLLQTPGFHFCLSPTLTVTVVVSTQPPPCVASICIFHSTPVSTCLDLTHSALNSKKINLERTTLKTRAQRGTYVCSRHLWYSSMSSMSYSEFSATGRAGLEASLRNIRRREKGQGEKDIGSFHSSWVNHGWGLRVSLMYNCVVINILCQTN